jgi:hypothetical protein
MRFKKYLCLVGTAVLLMGCETTKVRPDQSLSIVEPADGAVVTSPFKVKFAVSGMTVKPAGESGADVGHHHLLINRSSIREGQVIAQNDVRNLHFGKGQTEEMVSLPPGTYKLTAQFGDGFHKSYGQQLSQTITVTVK